MLSRSLGRCRNLAGVCDGVAASRKPLSRRALVALADAALAEEALDRGDQLGDELDLEVVRRGDADGAVSEPGERGAGSEVPAVSYRAEPARPGGSAGLESVALGKRRTEGEPRRSLEVELVALETQL